MSRVEKSFKIKVERNELLMKNIYTISDNTLEIAHKNPNKLFKKYIQEVIDYLTGMIKYYKEEDNDNQSIIKLTKETISKLQHLNKNIKKQSTQENFNQLESVLKGWCHMEFGNINFEVLKTF